MTTKDVLIFQISKIILRCNGFLNTHASGSTEVPTNWLWAAKRRRKLSKQM